MKESEPKSSGTKHVVQAEISHVSKILFFVIQMLIAVFLYYLFFYYVLYQLVYRKVLQLIFFSTKILTIIGLRVIGIQKPFSVKHKVKVKSIFNDYQEKFFKEKT